MHSWLHGSLSHVFGIPSFWVARIGVILQFTSAVYIVVDLVGKERIEEVGKAIVEWLRAGADSARTLGTNIGCLTIVFGFLLVLLNPQERRKIPARLALLLLLLAESILFWVILPHYRWVTIVPVVGVLLAAYELAGVLWRSGYLVVLALPLMLLTSIVEGITRGVSQLLGARSASRLLLVISVAALIAGFVLQLLAT